MRTLSRPLSWGQSLAVCVGVGLAFGLANVVSAADEPAKTDGTAKVLRAGIIGLDTSHVVAFTKLLNENKTTGPLSTVRIVAAFPGGSPDVPASANRIEGFTKTLRDTYKIEIVDSIPALLERVDVVFLESVDGRPHLEQARPVLAAKKPLFIDKPIAGTLADAVEIFELAKQHGTPVFSSSSVRFASGYSEAAERFAGRQDHWLRLVWTV